MGEVLVLLLIYLTGIFFGLLFVRRIPVMFAYLSGLLWGSLIWVLAGLLVSLVPGFYSLGSIVAAMGVVILVIFAFYRRMGLLREVLGGLWQVGAAGLVFLLLGGIFYQVNLTIGSADSVAMMIMARSIASEGLSIRTGWVAASPAGFGVYIPAIHSLGYWLQGMPLRSFQPLLALSLMAVFGDMVWLVGGRLGVSRVVRGLLAGLSALLLVSVPVMLYQAIYIHTNLAAAAFLFVALAAAWMMLLEDNKAWLVLVMVALAAFSLTRTESPIFAVMFLGLLLGVGKVPYRWRLYAFLPTLGFISIWLLAIASMKIGAYLDLLDRTSLLVMLGLNLLLAAFVLASGMRWVEEKLLPRLIWIEAGLLVLGLAGMAALKPDQMAASARSLISNLTVTGGWGGTWLAACLLLLFLSLKVRLPHEKLFAAFIPFYLCLTLMLGFMSSKPFYAGFVDSANRMATAALPPFLFYVMLKLMVYMRSRDEQRAEDPR